MCMGMTRCESRCFTADGVSWLIWLKLLSKSFLVSLSHPSPLDWKIGVELFILSIPFIGLYKLKSNDAAMAGKCEKVEVVAAEPLNNNKYVAALSSPFTPSPPPPSNPAGIIGFPAFATVIYMYRRALGKFSLEASEMRSGGGNHQEREDRGIHHPSSDEKQGRHHHHHHHYYNGSGSGSSSDSSSNGGSFGAEPPASHPSVASVAEAAAEALAASVFGNSKSSFASFDGSGGVQAKKARHSDKLTELTKRMDRY
jgi:hypothetical protein